MWLPSAFPALSPSDLQRAEREAAGQELLGEGVRPFTGQLGQTCKVTLVASESVAKTSPPAWLTTRAQRANVAALWDSGWLLT